MIKRFRILYSVILIILGLLIYIGFSSPQYKYQRALKFYNQKDYPQAIRIFKEAAEAGNAQSQFYLGMMYYKGQGIEQNTKQAVHFLEKAALQNIAQAQCNLGILYSSEIKGLATDMNKAKKHYLLAAKQGNAKALYNLGIIYFKEKNYQEALKYFTDAARNGQVNALVYAGIIYDKGLGVAQDNTKALSLYIQAAEHGNLKAQNRLILMYLEGNEIQRNNQEAIKWIKKSLEQEETVQTLNSFAWLMAENSVNLNEAQQYAEKALSKAPDNYSTLHTLGYIHYKQADYTRSIELLLKAIELNPNCQELRKHLSDAYYASGDIAKAETEWGKSLNHLNDETVKTELRQQKDEIKRLNDIDSLNKKIPPELIPEGSVIQEISD